MLIPERHKYVSGRVAVVAGLLGLIPDVIRIAQGRGPTNAYEVGEFMGGPFGAALLGWTLWRICAALMFAGEGTERGPRLIALPGRLLLAIWPAALLLGIPIAIASFPDERIEKQQFVVGCSRSCSESMAQSAQRLPPGADATIQQFCNCYCSTLVDRVSLSTLKAIKTAEDFKSKLDGQVMADIKGVCWRTTTPDQAK